MFITDWSFPSRMALKRIKKLYFDKKRCGIVDVDLVDSIELVDRFEVQSQISRLNQFHIASYSRTVKSNSIFQAIELRL